MDSDDDEILYESDVEEQKEDSGSDTSVESY